MELWVKNLISKFVRNQTRAMESYGELRRAMDTYGYTRLYDICNIPFKSYGELWRATESYGELWVNSFIYH